MDAKRQHVIPVMHLKWFTGREPDCHVWTYDAFSGEARPGTAENTAVEGYFYSAETPDGRWDHTLDRWLREVESKAAPAYRVLIRSTVPSWGQEKAYFSTFLASMYCRTKTMRRIVAESLSISFQVKAYAQADNVRLFGRLISGMKSSNVRVEAGDEEVIRQSLLNPGEYLSVHVPKEIALVEALRPVDRFTDIFMEMHWAVVGAAGDAFFLTSDNPLIYDVDPAYHHPVLGDGAFPEQGSQGNAPTIA